MHGPYFFSKEWIVIDNLVMRDLYSTKYTQGGLEIGSFPHFSIKIIHSLKADPIFNSDQLKNMRYPQIIAFLFQQSFFFFYFFHVSHPGTEFCTSEILNFWLFLAKKYQCVCSSTLVLSAGPKEKPSFSNSPSSSFTSFMSVIQGQNSAQNTKTDPVTQHTLQYFGLQGTERSQNIILKMKSIHLF